MKISLPVKLGIFIVALFAVVIAVCLLWKPVMIRYYANMLRKGSSFEKMKALDRLADFGEKGKAAIISSFPEGEKAGRLMAEVWPDVNENISLKFYREFFADSIDKNVRKFKPGKANNTDKCMFRAIHLAAWMGYFEAAALLLEKGADSNSEGYLDRIGKHGKIKYHGLRVLTPAAIAAYRDNLKMLKLLLKANPEIKPEFDWKLISAAALSNSMDVMKYLLDKGADINIKGDYRRTAMHLAMGYFLMDEGEAETKKRFIELLLKHGADVNARDTQDETPFIRAAICCNEAIVLLLIDHGADLDARLNTNGASAIHYSFNRQKNYRILIEKGCNVNAKKLRGQTPLHIAAGHFDGKKIVPYLIEHGADVNSVDVDGKTPLDFARDEKIEAILRAHGAKTADELKAER
ncbi:MAG: hypothetical protein E3J72_22340 [Planctomycetota bacterium]|nr:MAG: hypothetical protein E3J72_22340 [Planctomycetota bacterium]